MKKTDFYSNAHLVVAAIRIHAHQNAAFPTIDEVCRALSFSMEQGNYICKKLIGMGIIEVVEGAFETRIFIKNHLRIEEIPKGEKDSGLKEDIKKFQDSKKDFTQEIESFQAKQAKKQKDLFDELEKKMKNGPDKK
jgi:hypothetical protein